MALQSQNMSAFDNSFTSSSLPEYCHPISYYLFKFSAAFHSCVPTNLAFLSTILGICSIISWLFAQMPQIYKNYQLSSAAGLSIYFLAEWLLGDLTNLSGAILTKQAAWQVVVAAYYVTVDIMLLTQYIWYSHAKPWQKARLIEVYDADGSSSGGAGELSEVPPKKDGVSLLNDQNKRTTESLPNQSPQSQIKTQHQDRSSSSNITFNERRQPLSPDQHSVQSISRVCRPAPPHSALALTTIASLTVAAAARPYPLPSNSFLAGPLSTSVDPVSHASTAESIGRIFSWMSTVLYLLSRLPQIIKNAHRRSTSGLSPILFVAAFFGNFFYSASVLTNPLAWSSFPPHGLYGWVDADGSDRTTWIALAAPFWLGAAGVLVMDGIIFAQFVVLGDGASVPSILDGQKKGRKEVLLVAANDAAGDSTVEVTSRTNGDAPALSLTRSRSRSQAIQRGTIEGTGNTANDEIELELESGRGRTRWRKVTGWMRGWIPSPSPMPAVDGVLYRPISQSESQAQTQAQTPRQSKSDSKSQSQSQRRVQNNSRSHSESQATGQEEPEQNEDAGKRDRLLPTRSPSSRGSSNEGGGDGGRYGTMSET